MGPIFTRAFLFLKKAKKKLSMATPLGGGLPALLLPLWGLGTAHGFAHGGATRLLRALPPPRPLTPHPGTALQAKKFDKKYDDAFDDFRTSGRCTDLCAFPLCDGGGGQHPWSGSWSRGRPRGL